MRAVAVGVAVLAALVATAQAQVYWTSDGPFGGAEVFALAINPTTPTTLYAGTHHGGVFESTNGGSSWNAVNTGLTDTSVLALAINPTTPTTLYAGTNSGGVFQSTNGGSSWSAVNTGLASLHVQALAINPTTPTTLYAGTYFSGGVFQSTNGGSSWSAVNSGLTNLWVTALAINPTTPTTLYAGTLGGVFESTNGGSSWNAVNTGLASLRVQALAINPTTPTTLYAGTDDGGVFDTRRQVGSGCVVKSDCPSGNFSSGPAQAQRTANWYVAAENSCHPAASLMSAMPSPQSMMDAFDKIGVSYTVSDSGGDKPSIVTIKSPFIKEHFPSDTMMYFRTKEVCDATLKLTGTIDRYQRERYK
jgi:photosystem II stability/assembly factor-like uncharacterized protein